MTAPAVDEPIPDNVMAQFLAHKSRDGGSVLGDLPADEPPAPDATETPAVPATDDSADQPEDDEAEDAESPPTPTDPEAPADPASAPDPFEVLLKDAAPLAYRVNGADRAFDSILEVPGKGALIPADKLGEVRNLVARYESNADTVRDLLPLKQQVESFGGVSGIHERLEVSAQADAAALFILDAVMKDPTAFVMVEGNQIVPNPQALTLLRKEATIAANEAKWKMRTERTQAEQTSATTARDAEVKATAIPTAIDQHFAAYSTEDREAAKAIFGANPEAYLRPATPAEAQHFGIAVGHPMVLIDRIAPYFAHLKTVRGSVTQVAAKQTEAAKFNAAVTAKPQPKVAPKAKAQPRNADGTFTDAPKRKLDREDFMLAALSGKPTPGTTYDDE
jgi:hypothetical protein